MRDVKDPEIRRAEIMDAAMLLFMEKGYANTTTQDIVDKVNISYSENNSSLLSKLWITLRKATCLLRTSWCIILWIKI